MPIFGDAYIHLTPVEQGLDTLALPRTMQSLGNELG